MIQEDTAVIILAAGEQCNNWTEDAPRQLALIAGEPLLTRTLRQVQERGHEAITVTDNAEILEAIPGAYVPEACRWWPETLLATRELWAERTVVLNGDVIFSDAVLDAIYANKAPIGFYGKPTDCFGFTFSSEVEERVVHALEVAIEDATAGRGRLAGLVWTFYHAFCGLPLHARKHNWQVYHQPPPGDYTRDIDRVQQWEKFCRAHKWARGD